MATARTTSRSRLEELAQRSLATRAEAAAKNDVLLNSSDGSLNIPATPLLVVPAGSREARAVRLQEQNGFIRTPSGRELRIDPETGLVVENGSSSASAKAASRVVTSGLKIMKKEYSKFKKNKIPVHLFKGKRGSKNENTEKEEEENDDFDFDEIQTTAKRRHSSEEFLSQSFSEFGKRLSIKEGDNTTSRRKSLIQNSDDEDEKSKSYSDFSYNHAIDLRNNSTSPHKKRISKSMSPDNAMSRSSPGESNRRSRSTSNNSRHSKQRKHKDVVDRMHNSFNGSDNGNNSSSNLRRVPRRGKKPQHRQLQPTLSQSFSDFHYAGPSDKHKHGRGGSRDRTGKSKRSGDHRSRSTSTNGSRGSRDRSASGDSRRSSSIQRHNQHIQLKKEEFLSRLSNSCPSKSEFFDWAAAAAAASEEENIQRQRHAQHHRRNKSCDESGRHDLSRDKKKSGQHDKRNDKRFSISAPRLHYKHHDKEETNTKRSVSPTRRKLRRSSSSPEEGLSDTTKKHMQRLANHQRAKSEEQIPPINHKDKKTPQDIVALAWFHDSAPTTTTKSSSSFMDQLEQEMAKTTKESSKKKKSRSKSKKPKKRSKGKKKDDKKEEPMELSWFGLPTANDMETTATPKQPSTTSMDGSSTSSDEDDDVSIDDSASDDSASDDCFAVGTIGGRVNNLERSMSILDLMDDAYGDVDDQSNN